MKIMRKFSQPKPHKMGTHWKALDEIDPMVVHISSELSRILQKCHFLKSSQNTLSPQWVNGHGSQLTTQPILKTGRAGP